MEEATASSPARVADLSSTAFAKLPRNAPGPESLPASWNELSHLNRYVDVLPNPHTRVELEARSSSNPLGYINANFVRLCAEPPVVYIAAMGPVSATREDFWKMIWEQNSTIVVMLTGLIENGTNKCARYWPSQPGKAEEVSYGEFTVAATCTDNLGAYVRTKLALGRGAETREVYHFWYNTWPDHGAPREVAGVLDLIRDIRETAARGALGPWVVHCSAGIGRTGTFIAIDWGSRQLARGRRTDVLTLTRAMRESRGSMIQAPPQAEFAYRALVRIADDLNSPSSAALWQDL